MVLTKKITFIKSAFLLALLLFSVAELSAQNFGGNPNRIKYQQIENDTLRVVFPVGMEYWAQRVANFGMYQASLLDSSLTATPYKTTIIIRNLTTISNGFVAYAPYRSEYFSTPPFNQFSGNSPWVDLLHIHEYRHILQESKVMSKRWWAPEHLLFGQGGWSVVNYALLPNWFSEGDAVKTETRYTLSGRGRVPLFYLQIPALRANGKKFSFDKMRSGSFKDPIPSHYVLGYHMTSQLEMEKGIDSWDRITNRSIRNYALISWSTKKLYGYSNRDLYERTNQHIDSFYADSKESNDSIVLDLDPKNFTSYELPKSLKNGSILYLKFSYRSIPAFYTYDGKTEKKVFEPGMVHSEHWYDLFDNKLIWTEYLPNNIWQNENYSSLKILDIETGKARYLGKKKSKYFYPKWSENGENIAVIEVNENTHLSVNLLDKNAQVLNDYHFELGTFISAIIKVEGNTLLLVKNKDEKSQIISLDISTGSITEISEGLNSIIRHPISKGDYIYFSTPVGISEQIIRLSTSNGSTEVMSEALFRAIDPMIHNGELYYVSYEGVGYKIKKTPLDVKSVYNSTLPDIAFYGEHPSSPNAILDSVPNVQYKVSKFRKSKELLEFHSWIPQLLPPNFGLTLLLENKIGTFSGELTYVYNTNEGASQFSGRINYAQLFPKFYVGASHTLNRNANTVDFPFDQIPGTFSGRSWSESEINAGLITPFYLNRGKWSRYLSIDASANYMFANLSEYHSSLSDLQFPFAKGRLTFYNLKKQSKRQLNPRWGQYFIFNASQSFDPEIATQAYIYSTFYFPGLFKTHSLTISPYLYYEPLGKEYYFLNAFPGSYGYSYGYRAQNKYRVLLKYSMPIWYPDFGITGLAFFKRLFGSAFYDHSQFLSPGRQTAQLRSLGLELNLDMVLLRIFPFRIGVRGYYRLDIDPDPNYNPSVGQDPFGWEILFYGFSF